jgi:hypothetical protein
VRSSPIAIEGRLRVALRARGQRRQHAGQQRSREYADLDLFFAVRYITTGFGNFWGLFSAFIIVAFVPVLAIFVAFQRWFIAGMTSGGVKG